MPHARERAFELLGHPASALAGLQFLEDRAASSPEDSTVLFDCAEAYDILGREAEAVAMYERVRELGLDALPSADHARWHVQMGSSLRLIGRLEESRAILNAGARSHPDHAALPAFLALTEISAGRPQTALAHLFAALLSSDEAGSIARYRPALESYAARIDIGPEGV